MEVKVISRAVGTANIIEWARLALRDLHAPVLRVARLRHDHQGSPIAFENVVLVLGLFPDLADDDDAIHDIAELARQYGRSLARSSERISIVPAGGEIAHHLGVAPGTDVLKLDRIVETSDGVPAEWRVAFSKA